MIFNLSQGGVSTLAVTAPTGASISASCQGLTVTGTGTCTLELPIIGTWTITCIVDGTTKTNSVTVTTYGAVYSVSFSYSATISVSTHPSAAVTATKSGQTTLSGTANSSGVCTLTVPAGGLGSWNVTANNGVVSASSSVNVANYDNTYSVSILRNIPIIVIYSGGSSWTYKGSTIDNSVVKITPNGTGWKAWLRASCTVTFTYIPTNVSFWAIGKGGNGASHWGSSGYYGGGGGGGGGQVDTQNNKAVSTGTNYVATIGTYGSSFGSIISVGNGEDGAQPSGGSSGGGSGNGSTGEWVNDHSYPPSSGGGGDGGNGVYAFSDSSFDGVVYGHGGGGGKHSVQQGGYHSTTAGSGGGGGGRSNVGRTDGNVGIICMKNAS